MTIYLSLLEEYIKKNRGAAVISIDTDDKEPFLRFTHGSDRQGSRNEYLSFRDLDSILEINGIIDAVTEEKDTPHEELLKRHYSQRDKDKNIEELIYNLLAKYIIQILNAGTGKVLFPEIIPLEMHKANHFRND